MATIRVNVDERGEISASRAKLHLRLEGETFVLGNAALEKAKELRELVAALLTIGVAKENITVAGVRVASASGLLGKNQRAQFRLVIGVASDQIGAALGVVAAQKNLTLEQLEWVFEEFEASIALSAQAMQKARRKADAIAAAAGHKVVGVQNASDSWDMPVQNVYMQQDAMVGMARARSAEAVDVGVEYNATQSLNVHLTVDFTLE